MNAKRAKCIFFIDKFKITNNSNEKSFNEINLIFYIPSNINYIFFFFPGVLVAIVIAGIAVLIAIIRLIVYCCQRNTS